MSAQRRRFHQITHIPCAIRTRSLDLRCSSSVSHPSITHLNIGMSRAHPPPATSTQSCSGCIVLLRHFSLRNTSIILERYPTSTFNKHGVGWSFGFSYYHSLPSLCWYFTWRQLITLSSKRIRRAFGRICTSPESSNPGLPPPSAKTPGVATSSPERILRELLHPLHQLATTESVLSSHQQPSIQLPAPPPDLHFP